MEHSPPPFFRRGPSPLALLSLFSALSVVLLVADARFRYLEPLRSAVAVVLYPLQRAATAPFELMGRAADFFASQSQLVEENARLRQQRLQDASAVQRHAALAAENAKLRELLEARARTEGTALAAEILYGSREPFSRKVIVDKGGQHGVGAGHAVIDANGVVGQVTRAYPLVSEVTLLTDKDHAVPVQVQRSGVRAIVFGYGDTALVELRFMSASADVQNGDLLVTSGLDGTYPPGLPVAVVNRIERNADTPFARIFGTPVAGVDRSRQLLIIAPPAAMSPRPEEAQPENLPRSRRSKRGG